MNNMPIMNDTLIDGVLTSKDGYEITNKRYNLANVDENLTLHISHDDLNMDIDAKALDVSSSESINITTDKAFTLTTDDNISISSNSKSINIDSASILSLGAKRIVLNNKDFIYGTVDPNEVVIPQLSEGTLYFRLLRD